MKAQTVAPSLAGHEAINPADRLATLFDDHYARLYRLARRLVPSADDALDLVQETFVRVARSGTPVPAGAAAEEAWLVRTLINIQRDAWRKAVVRTRLDPRPSGIPNPEAAWVAKT